MLKAMTNSLLAIRYRHCQLTVIQPRHDILGDRFRVFTSAVISSDHNSVSTNLGSLPH